MLNIPLILTKEKKTKYMNLQLYTSLAIVAISLACGSAAENNETAARPNLKVDAFIVDESPFNSEVVTTANLLPLEQVELKAPIAGQVLKINFKEGSQIKAGQAIVQLDDRAWKAQLIGLEAQLKNAEKDFERKQSLVDFGGSSDEEIDIARTTIENLKSQIQQLKVNIDLANVRAPFSGVLGMRDFSLGAYLSTGESITVLTQTGQIKVDFTIAAQHHKSISIGNNITVLIDGDSLSATVYAISPTINLDSRTLNVRAELDLPEKTSILPGTFAEVIIPTDFSDAALLIPTQAVVPEINDQTVYVYQNGTAIKKQVYLGDRTADLVHITSGLGKGDTIITTGLLQVKDGMPVTLQSISK